MVIITTHTMSDNDSDVSDLEQEVAQMKTSDTKKKVVKGKAAKKEKAKAKSGKKEAPKKEAKIVIESETKQRADDKYREF